MTIPDEKDRFAAKLDEEALAAITLELTQEASPSKDHNIALHGRW